MSAEQRARDLLDRLGMPNAQALNAGDVTELANLIATSQKTVSIQEACRVVGVSRRTIYNWLRTGKVEYLRTAGGSVRIIQSTLWRLDRERPPAATPEVRRSTSEGCDDAEERV